LDKFFRGAKCPVGIKCVFSSGAKENGRLQSAWRFGEEVREAGRFKRLFNNGGAEVQSTGEA
jgi:hypothetical protein